MNSQTLGLRVAGTIFGLVGLVQVLRLTTQAEVVVGGRRIPVWPSAIGAGAGCGLSLWLWKLSEPGNP